MLASQILQLIFHLGLSCSINSLRMRLRHCRFVCCFHPSMFVGHDARQAAELVTNGTLMSWPGIPFGCHFQCSLPMEPDRHHLALTTPSDHGWNGVAPDSLRSEFVNRSPWLDWKCFYILCMCIELRVFCLSRNTIECAIGYWRLVAVQERQDRDCNYSQSFEFNEEY